MSQNQRVIYTIGHSTRPLSEFTDILEKYGISVLVDIRKMPRSRTNPQFNSDTLQEDLKRVGIEYIHSPGLGGLRHAAKDSKNTAWRNTSFRGYADHMQSEEFSEAVEALSGIAISRTTAVMCAEAVPWRCHRSLLGDALIARGFRVIDILDSNHSQDHKLTNFAKVDGLKVTYAADSSQEKLTYSGAN